MYVSFFVNKASRPKQPQIYLHWWSFHPILHKNQANGVDFILVKIERILSRQFDAPWISSSVCLILKPRTIERNVRSDESIGATVEASIKDYYEMTIHRRSPKLSNIKESIWRIMRMGFDLDPYNIVLVQELNLRTITEYVVSLSQTIILMVQNSKKEPTTPYKNNNAQEPVEPIPKIQNH